MKILKFFIPTICLLFFVFIPQATAAGKFGLTALDTVAHFPTRLTATGRAPGESVTFIVRAPGVPAKEFSARADASGSAEIELSPEETRAAGLYRVELKENLGLKLRGSLETASFEVFPGEMSVQKSQISGAAVSDGGRARIVVHIQDDFGNALAFQEVNLVSSRSADVIEPFSAPTDEQGNAVFEVRSHEPGRSVFTATNESSGDTLEKRLTLVFGGARSVSKSIGGDPESLLLAQSGPLAARFEISNLAPSVDLSQTVSFTVTALDTAGAVVPSYAGRIVFSSSDPNAQFPTPYVFQPSDQGRKTFDLALRFATAGSQRFSVQEEGRPTVRGEKSVEVRTASSGSGQIFLTKPSPGMRSTNTLEISGQTSPSAQVLIFDREAQLAVVQADASGKFSYMASALRDGQHIFSVQSGSAKSDSVTVTIDSTAASVSRATLTPPQSGPGETTSIEILTDSDAASVKASLGNFVVDLTPDPKTPGRFTGVLTLPQASGQYAVSLVVTDRVGNETPMQNVGTVAVDPRFRSSGGFFVPSKVSGVRAVSGNGRITLSWNPAQSNAGIALYRIYYGTDPSHLTLIANTSGSATTWTIPNLINGTPYFFQVVGVDAHGAEGDNRSDLLRVAPSLYGGGGLVLCDPEPCPGAYPPPGTPQDGPQILGMVIASLVGAGVWRIKSKMKTPTS